MLKVKVNVDDQHITLLMDVVSLDMYEREREYKLPLELGPHNDEVTMRENAPTIQSNQVTSFLFPPCVFVLFSCFLLFLCSFFSLGVFFSLVCGSFMFSCSFLLSLFLPFLLFGAPCSKLEVRLLCKGV